jgi:NADPH:quinone reductase-like Zn-dependent oxidoreductase
LPFSPGLETAGIVAACGEGVMRSSHVAIRWQGHLEPAETLLVLGAAGGVGLTAVEIGKALGRASSRQRARTRSSRWRASAGPTT